MQTADTTRTIDVALGGASFITLAVTLSTILKTSLECFCVLRTDKKTRCLTILHSPNKSTTTTAAAATTTNTAITTTTTTTTAAAAAAATTTTTTTALQIYFGP